MSKKKKDEKLVFPIVFEAMKSKIKVQQSCYLVRALFLVYRHLTITSNVGKNKDTYRHLLYS